MIDKNKYLNLYLEKEFRGDFKTSEPLSRHTWYKIGGPAEFFVCPYDIMDLINLIKQCRHYEIKTFLMGDGANLLADDDGYRGVIICMKKHFKQMRIDGNNIIADAGVFLEDLVLLAERNSLGGVHFLSGIPGTVGGAVIMNAGTNVGAIGERIKEVFILDRDLERRTIPADMLRFKYRFVPELQDKIVLGCRLGLIPHPRIDLEAFRIDQIAKRRAKQPLEYPSCGSVFKSPPNHYVGKLVEDAGLKGLRHGNAMVSKKHGGFIVNLGGATSSDVQYLIEKVKGDVFQQHGVVLETEVRYLKP